MVGTARCEDVDCVVFEAANKLIVLPLTLDRLRWFDNFDRALFVRRHLRHAHVQIGGQADACPKERK